MLDGVNFHACCDNSDAPTAIPSHSPTYAPTPITANAVFLALVVLLFALLLACMFCVCQSRTKMKSLKVQAAQEAIKAADAADRAATAAAKARGRRASSDQAPALRRTPTLGRFQGLVHKVASSSLMPSSGPRMTNLGAPAGGGPDASIKPKLKRKKSDGKRKKKRRSSTADIRERRKNFREKRKNSGTELKTMAMQILDSGVLQKVKVFKDAKVTEEGMGHMAENLELEAFKPGQPICKEGEEGHKLFIVTQGCVNVLKHGKVVCTLGVNQSFGEIALLHEHSKRTATIVAKGRCSLLSLTRDAFQHVISEHASRSAVRKMEHASEALLLNDRVRKQAGPAASSVRKGKSKGRRRRRGSAAMISGGGNDETAPKLRRKTTMKSVFKSIDADNSGSIDFPEFLEAVSSGTSQDDLAARKLFDLVDEDKSGTIEKDEMVRVLRKNDEAVMLSRQFPNFLALLDSASKSVEARASRRSKRRKTMSAIPDMSKKQDNPSAMFVDGDGVRRLHSSLKMAQVARMKVWASRARKKVNNK